VIGEAQVVVATEANDWVFAKPIADTFAAGDDRRGAGQTEVCLLFELAQDAAV